MNLPVEVERATSTYLALADDRLPGLVEGLYLHGSLGFGEFHPERSDIDFVAAVAERPDAEQVVALGEVLGEVARRHPRPHFDGIHVLRTDLAAIPSGCPDVPCFHEGRFDPAGRFELNPVTWHELAWHGVTVRGEPLRESDVWTDRAALREFTYDNLKTYWRPLVEQMSSAPVDKSEWLTEWFVLGTARLHHLLATGALTSKGGAGRHALRTFASRWHPVVVEALRIREGGIRDGRPGPAERYADDPATRITDLTAFSEMVIEAGLELRG
ncbi:aminoglycoside adenylyltransferase domain-containing protein [Actinomycetes bacterium KLBMP 9759]